MPRSESEPLRRVHLHIYERDYERLLQFYGDTTGVSKAARTMIRRFLHNVEARAAAKAASKPLPEIPQDITDGVEREG